MYDLSGLFKKLKFVLIRISFGLITLLLRTNLGDTLIKDFGSCD